MGPVSGPGTGQRTRTNNASPNRSVTIEQRSMPPQQNKPAEDPTPSHTREEDDDVAIAR